MRKLEEGATVVIMAAGKWQALPVIVCCCLYVQSYSCLIVLICGTNDAKTHKGALRTVSRLLGHIRDCGVNMRQGKDYNIVKNLE